MISNQTENPTLLHLHETITCLILIGDFVLPIENGQQISNIARCKI